MLGIDIVDLTDPKLGERDDRSLKLVQHPDDTLIDHDKIFWLLWSAKEAAFKCYRDTFPFSPTSIPIQISNEDGQMTFQSGDLSGIFEINGDHILAICSDDINTVAFNYYQSDKVIDSASIRNYIKEYFDEKATPISIGSDDLNLPMVLPANEPISISHHGHMAAFAYPKSILNV